MKNYTTYSSQSKLKSDINYTDSHRFSWDVCTIFKTSPNRGSIFLHKEKKLDENEDKGREVKGSIKITEQMKKLP